MKQPWEMRRLDSAWGSRFVCSALLKIISCSPLEPAHLSCLQVGSGSRLLLWSVLPYTVYSHPGRMSVRVPCPFQGDSWWVIARFNHYFHGFMIWAWFLETGFGGVLVAAVVVESLSCVCLCTHTHAWKDLLIRVNFVSQEIGFQILSPQITFDLEKVQESDSLRVCIFKHKPLDSGCAICENSFRDKFMFCFFLNVKNCTEWFCALILIYCKK